MPYIYKITNILNGKSYIGKTMQTIEARWKKHCNDFHLPRCNKRPLYNAMTKYGIDAFKIETLEECSDIEVNEREKYWIQYYDTFTNGYNATLGGDGKAYIDYDLVATYYLQTENCEKVAQMMNICPDSVRTILRAKKIPIKSAAQHNKEKLSKAVNMYDKTSGILLQTFPSRAEAARWLIEHNMTNCKASTIRTHIGEVCNGKRQSAAGFIWKNQIL